ncbi:hypothetical protein BV25DRAFT_1820746 [Artomyces pyxidatus]|uniref:Uncharacterized protein n=1 Tax=Artomyces pyxidatus TaxID=48021 RepID=A0ACB8TE43_9AGAM|nr:hypothetical protein BV25DRAFT_1820746 [Artomyces pyxidatus]
MVGIVRHVRDTVPSTAFFFTALCIPSVSSSISLTVANLLCEPEAGMLGRLRQHRDDVLKTQESLQPMRGRSNRKPSRPSDAWTGQPEFRPMPFCVRRVCRSPPHPEAKLSCKAIRRPRATRRRGR